MSNIVSNRNINGKKENQQAFTLIELLVVIAIIALLMSIVMPSLQKVKMHARDTICKVNIKGLGLSYHTYLIDNDERFLAYDQLLPGAWNSDIEVTGSRRDQKETILIKESPLLKYEYTQPEILVCPVFRAVVEKLVRDQIPDIGVSFSYTLNSGIDPEAADQFKPYDKIPKKLSQIKTTSGLGMFMEENPWRHPVYGNQGMNDGRFVVQNWPDHDTLATYHYPNKENYGLESISANSYPGGKSLNSGRSHVVFIDNHVEAVPTTHSEKVAYQEIKWANRPDLW